MVVMIPTWLTLHVFYQLLSKTGWRLLRVE